MPELIVLPVHIRKQFLMGSCLDDLPTVEHRNFVTEPAGGKPVADIDSGLIPHDLVEPFVNLRFGDGVQGRGGFVQDDEGCI